ncbi:ATPase, partial [Enterococcus faecalis]
SNALIESKNVIFRGAPGTGKSYLAKEIATDIISNGYFCDYTLLNDEQKKQIEFVQFHPSYDYSDFVEGLRPKPNED